MADATSTNCTAKIWHLILRSEGFTSMVWSMIIFLWYFHCLLRMQAETMMILFFGTTMRISNYTWGELRWEPFFIIRRVSSFATSAEIPCYLTFLFRVLPSTLIVVLFRNVFNFVVVSIFRGVMVSRSMMKFLMILLFHWVLII